MNGVNPAIQRINKIFARHRAEIVREFINEIIEQGAKRMMEISTEELRQADLLLQKIEDIDERGGEGTKRRAEKIATIAECCRSSFRLRCKVYSKGGRLYLIGGGLLGQEGKIMTFAMSDEDSLMLELSVDEYNALPYHWFESRGAAPKGSAVRPTTVPWSPK